VRMEGDRTEDDHLGRQTDERRAAMHGPTDQHEPAPGASRGPFSASR
jgi:hypothetical protein